MGATLRTVMRVEWRSLVRERAVWLVVALFAGLVAYAAVAGGSQVRSERAAIEAARREEAARLEQLGASLRGLPAGAEARSGADPRDPHVVGREIGRRAAILPPGPLAPVAIGQRDVMPHTVHVTSEARLAAGAADADLGSPTRQTSGPFDLAFVIVYLLPLVIIALTFDLLAGERERGTLALVLSQPVSLRSFVLGKALLRAACLLGLVVPMVVAAPLLAGGAAAGGGLLVRLGLFGALLIAYSAFWFAAALAVDAWGRSAAGNALALVGVWLALVVIVPGLVSVGVNALHPPPSRVELVQLTRSAAREAEAQLSAIEGDHGERPADAYGKSVRRGVEVQEELERRVQPVVDAFGVQLARQQGLVDRLRFLSPAIVAHEGLNDVSGSGVARYQHFAAQVDVFHRAHKAFFFDRIRRAAPLDAADFESLPAFDYREQPTADLGARVGAGIVGLLVPALALLGLAIAGLRRARISA